MIDIRFLFFLRLTLLATELLQYFKTTDNEHDGKEHKYTQSVVCLVLITLSAMARDFWNCPLGGNKAKQWAFLSKYLAES